MQLHGHGQTVAGSDIATRIGGLVRKHTSSFDNLDFAQHNRKRICSAALVLNCLH
jgi:hypothetical protein